MNETIDGKMIETLIDESVEFVEQDVLLKEEDDRVFIKRGAVRFTVRYLGERRYVLSVGLVRHQRQFSSERDIPRCVLYLGDKQEFYMVGLSIEQFAVLVGNSDDTVSRWIKRVAVSPKIAIKYLIQPLTEWYEEDAPLSEDVGVIALVESIKHSKRFQALTNYHTTSIVLSGSQQTAVFRDHVTEQIYLISAMEHTSKNTTCKNHIVCFKNKCYLCGSEKHADIVTKYICDVLKDRPWDEIVDPMGIQIMCYTTVDRNDLSVLSEFLWMGFD